jgi:basic membrane protein A
MKKALALVLVLCIAFGALTACAAKETAVEGEKTYKVAMICDSSISDGGWGAACYNGMTAAAATRGWETAYTDAIEQSAYADTMISYCDAGYDMIFAPGNQYSDAVKQVAADYPDVCFAVLNGSTELPTDNIMSMLPNADQIGSIAGIIAGLMSESNVIGFIGGMELDTTKSKLAHFESAAQVINPDIKAVSAYAGSFNDTAKGMELAASMINEGADVFFGDASAVDSGARQAIDQANGDTVKIIDIGQPSDLLGQNPCVACSVVTDNAGMLAICLEKAENGTFGNEVVFGSLENGCVFLGSFNNDLIDAETQAKIVEYVQQLQDGTFGK